jgi:hypothetical protein
MSPRQVLYPRLRQLLLLLSLLLWLHLHRLLRLLC